MNIILDFLLDHIWPNCPGILIWCLIDSVLCFNRIWCALDCCRDLNHFYENDKVTFEEKCCLCWAELGDALELDKVARGVIGRPEELSKTITSISSSEHLSIASIGWQSSWLNWCLSPDVDHAVPDFQCMPMDVSSVPVDWSAYQRQNCWRLYLWCLAATGAGV